MKKAILLLGMLLTANAGAQIINLQCGSFQLQMIENSMSKVNGEYVTSQKITEFGQNGIKMEMTLMPASDGNNYGFEYVHPDGSKSHFLNVELIRTNMDQPRVIGSFPCTRVAG